MGLIRFANKYKQNNISQRELYKAYGIKFVINVSVRASKFNVMPFLMTVGSGLGLMSFCVVISDWVLLYFIKERKLIRRSIRVRVDKHFSLNQINNFN